VRARHAIWTSVLAAAVAAGGAGASAPTVLRTYMPFDEATHARVKGAASGYCWTGSLSDVRADAWRCFIGNSIYDPCFSAGGSFVLCPVAGPWAPEVVKIVLTRKLPRGAANHAGDPKRSRPWAIRTTSGLRCTFLDGATEAVGGKRLNYGCRAGAGLYGDPRRATVMWTILARKSGRLEPIGIAEAWW
jgi:hypothetical protein